MKVSWKKTAHGHLYGYRKKKNPRAVEALGKFLGTPDWIRTTFIAIFSIKKLLYHTKIAKFPNFIHDLLISNLTKVGTFVGTPKLNYLIRPYRG